MSLREEKKEICLYQIYKDALKRFFAYFYSVYC